MNLRSAICGVLLILSVQPTMAFEPGSRHHAWLDAVLETGADVPAPPRVGALDETGRTLLHYAAAGGSLGAVERLITEGAPVNARATDGSTPLVDVLAAAPDDALAITEALLQAGANPDLGRAGAYGDAHYWARVGVQRRVLAHLHQSDTSVRPTVSGQLLSDYQQIITLLDEYHSGRLIDHYAERSYTPARIVSIDAALPIIIGRGDPNASASVARPLHFPVALRGALGVMPVAISVGYGVWGLDAGLRGYLSYYGDSRRAPTWDRGGVFLEARYVSFGGALRSLPGIEDGSIAHWQRVGVSVGVDVHLGGGDVEGWPLKSFMHFGTVATLYLWGGVGIESTIGLSL